MKKPLTFLAAFVLFAFVSRAAHATQKPEPFTVAIVVDTSPTGRWSDMRKAAENVYKSCAAGDTILVYSVKGRATHLRYSCLKRARDYELEDLSSILKIISCDWFIRADITRALKDPIYRKILQHSGPKGRAMVAVITEGNISGRQVSELVKFTCDIKSTHNWPVVITGSIGRTHKGLLSAASAGLLHWCDLAKAVDSRRLNKWMQQIRPPALIARKKETRVATPVIAEPGAKDREQASSPESELPAELSQVTQQSELAVTPDVNTIPSAEHGPEPAFESADKKFQEKTTEPNATSIKPSKEVKRSSTESEGKTGKSILAVIEERAKEPIVATAKPPARLSVSPGSPKSSSAEESAAPSVQPKPVVATRKPVQPIPFVPKKAKVDFGVKPTSCDAAKPNTPAKAVWSPILLVGGISFCSVAALVLVTGWLGARKWRQTAESSLSAAEQEQQDQPKILMVQVNSTLHRIGNFQRLKSFRIGTDPQNAIRLDRDGVAPHHVRIFRRREKLFLRNLARDPVVLNGAELRRRKQCQLILPAVLTIADGVRVYLFLEKEAPDKAINLEEK